jgi:hypothetical protein
LTLFFSSISFVFWYELLFFVESLFFIHWLGLISTIFIALLVPIYYVLKRKKPPRIKSLLRIHVFGNLLAYMLVSIHFSQNTGRLIANFLKLEDGFVLFLVLSIIIATGMFERFSSRKNFMKYIKPIHRYTVIFFYFFMLVHTLQGFNVI